MNDAIKASFGINVAGYIKGEFGLAEGARANIRSIKAAGIPYTVNNINNAYHRSLDSTHSDGDFSQDNPYAVNLVNVNPEHLPDLISSGNLDTQYFQNRYNIGFWYWELPRFPPEWYSAFSLFDEIWTGSNHAAEAISEISPVPVVKVMPSLDIPKPSLSRERLGIPKDKFIFLFMFDSLSTFERKNPFALIEAFKKAFGKSHKDILLAIKFSNSHYYPHQRDKLKALAAEYPSLHLIDGHLTKDEVNALVYNCDCYVSLHRAEGFGLTMAEAMFYGKPVIGTAYSSNTEFMNVGNSFPVKYDLVPIAKQDNAVYQAGSVWAEPDIDHAACLMLHVFENYHQAQQVGARAAKEIKLLLSPHAIGRRIRSRLEYIMNKPRKNYPEENWLESKCQALRKAALDAHREIKQSI
jgi:glycosyltransferase involved in cell wall biosynthesis